MACLGIGIEDAYASAFEVELAKASEGSSQKDPQTSKSNVIQHPKSGKPSQVSEMLGEEADPEPEPEQSSDCKAVLSILNRCKTKQDVEGAVNDKREAVKALPKNEQAIVIALKDKLLAELIDDDMPVWD